MLQYKSVPILTAMQHDSTRVSTEKVYRKANEVDYPHLTILAEKDVVVSNEAATKWHERSGSKLKQICVVPNALHLVFKEPDGLNRVYEAILNFTETLAHNKPLGVIHVSKIRLAKYEALWRRKRFWLFTGVAFLTAYLLLAVAKGRKDLFLSWHWNALLVIARRLIWI